MSAVETVAEVVEAPEAETKATPERVRSPFPSTLFYGVPITGNLTRDPVIRFTNSGRAVLNTAVAINQRRQQDGGWVDSQPSYVDLIMYGPADGAVSGQLDNIMETLKMGARVVAIGDFRNRTYETSDGRRGTAAEMLCSVIAADLTFAKAEMVKTNGRSVAVEEPF